jgi:hypothetical protein
MPWVIRIGTDPRFDIAACVALLGLLAVVVVDVGVRYLVIRARAS